MLSQSGYKPRIPLQTRAFLLALALQMALMTSLRLAFLSLNRGSFRGTPFRELALAFLNGARFDLHIVLLLLAPFFLVLHIPGCRAAVPVFARRAFWLPLFLFLPLAALGILDMHYYREAGRHLSYEIAFVTGESYDLKESLTMVAQYRLSIAIFAGLSLLLVLAWRLILKGLWKERPRGRAGSEAAWLVLFLVFSLLGIRGNFSGRPLRMSDAFLQGRTELGHLSLNPQFTVARSFLEIEGPVPDFFPEGEAVETVRGLLGAPGTSWDGEEAPLFRRETPSRAGPEQKYNLVVIVLESWSSRFVSALGYEGSITPGFDALAREGILFRNFFAVGSRTDEGLASLCLGVPSFNSLNTPGKGSILSGSLEQNRYAGLGSILAENGYDTVYVHGESSRAFRQASLARLAGFRRHIGKEELGLSREETSGPWGGWDHVLLERLLDLIKGEREPFAVLWVSLSNHAPYTLPDDAFRTARPDDPDGRFVDSIRYTDHHLGLFFEKIRQEDCFDRTVFVITADHSARVITSLEDRHRIPLLIYAPGILEPGEHQGIGSQTDLLPTILDILGLESSHHAMGRSLVDRESEGFAFLNFSSGYGWLSDAGLLEIDPEGRLIGIRENHFTSGDGGDSEKQLKRALCYIQLGRNLLLENRFVPLP